MAEESKVIPSDADLSAEDRVQASFERRVGEVLPDIINDLRHKNAHMIDKKAMKQLKKGNVSYKSYDESNAINCYDDTQKICFADIVKTPYEL